MLFGKHRRQRRVAKGRREMVDTVKAVRRHRATNKNISQRKLNRLLKHLNCVHDLLSLCNTIEI
jgi:hypothetical protein